MAIKQDLITLGSVTLYDIDSDPSVGIGLSGFVGDMAITDAGTLWIKTGSGDTNWERIHTDVSDPWLSEAKPTGITSVPTLAINTNPSLIDIGPFTYILKGIRYTYAGATGVNPSFTNGAMFSYIAINSSGTLTFYSNYDGIDQSNNIVFAIASSLTPTTPGGTVSAIVPVGWNLSEREYRHTQWMDDAVGFLFSTGGITYNAATPRQVGISAGEYYGPHQGKRTIAASAAISAYAVYHVAGAWTYNLSSPITLSNTQYDNGTNLVNSPNNHYTVFTILYATQNNRFYVIYPQTTYSTLQQAENQAPQFGPFIDYHTSKLVPIANIIIRQGDTNIIEHVDTRPQITFGRSIATGVGSVVSLQNAYEASLEPEILLNATRGAVSIRDTSTPLGVNLFEVTNNAASQAFLTVRADNVQIPISLGIGTVPASGQKLHVSGNTRIDSVGVTPAATGSIGTSFGGSIAFRGSYNGTTQRLMGHPNVWIKINVNGTDYNVPGYVN